MLYSYMKGYPQEKPTRIRLNDGSTRTGDLSDEQLEEAGYIAVEDKPINTDRAKVVEWNYSTASWNVRDKTEVELRILTEDQWKLIRNERNSLLSQTDWTQIADAPKPAQYGSAGWYFRTAMLTYRSKLRDITKQEDPFNIVWPELPTLENSERLVKQEAERSINNNTPSQIEGDEDGN